MAVLVASLKSVLSNRCGGMVTDAGLDGSAASMFWLDPIATSARELGITLADPTTVTDADLAGVTQGQVTQFLDVAELRSLESALHNNVDVTEKIALGEHDWSDVRKSLETAVARKAAYVKARWGIGLGTITGGTISLDFAETMDCMGNINP